MDKQFWVFIVTGGEALRFQVQGNPIQSHDGQRSVLRALCTDSEADKVAQELRSQGCHVVIHSPREDDQAKQERTHNVALMETGLPEDS